MRRWRARPEYVRERFAFDVDMLLMQTFQVRDLPDETVERIFDRAEREMTFVRGVHRSRQRYTVLRTTR